MLRHSRVTIRSASVAITSIDLMRRSALIARHSLAYSSITVSNLAALPSRVLSKMKS